MTDRQKLQRNISRALYFRFFQAFMVLVPVAVPFFQSKGLTMRDVFTLALFAGVVVGRGASAQAICLTPSGVVGGRIVLWSGSFFVADRRGVLDARAL